MSVHRTPHHTDDQLIQRLYGAGPEADPHFDACEECQARWEQLELQHAAILDASPASEGFLEQQSVAIHRRVEAAPAPWAILSSAWVPAALAMVLIAGLLFYRVGPGTPAPPSESAKMESADPVEGAAFVDAKWFEDAYSQVGAIEPRAATPIRELFAEEVIQ